ncbi:hypothetical protein Godav_011473 [Gossypium davidsonii]|uniref:hAT-like transposase RNase-H fold domain-containing protein n=1 Tax=Gossypium davidsonii TaxID=34287 RepID=A0A7J8R9Y6_GOSDV|nr:hypothetical protein [Gossypium davidsonii]
MADKSFHLNVTKKLRRDVSVRWNSTYLMFESTLYYKYVLDYWGQWDKDFQILALSDEEWRNYYFTTIYTTHTSDFVETILCNLKILFDEYVKNSKSMSSSLARSFNISDNDPIDSSLHQLNVNKANLGGDYDESDDYK